MISYLSKSEVTFIKFVSQQQISKTLEPEFISIDKMYLKQKMIKIWSDW